jgi:hypothetical protein
MNGNTCIYPDKIQNLRKKWEQKYRVGVEERIGNGNFMGVAAGVEENIKLRMAVAVVEKT